MKDREKRPIAQARTTFIWCGVAFTLCIIADCLLGWKPEGGETFLFGYGSTTLASVPRWHYIVALPFGIAVAVMMAIAAPEVSSLVGDCSKVRGKEPGRAVGILHACMVQLPLAMLVVHTEFCIFLMVAQGMVEAGLSAQTIDGALSVPVLVSFLPFYVWCMVLNILITVSLCVIIGRGVLPVKKLAVLCTPLIAKVLVMGILQVVYLLPAGSTLGFLDITTDSISYAIMFFMLAYTAQKALVRPPVSNAQAV